MQYLLKVFLLNAGIYLKDVILETLSKYGVHPKQLYTITSDNGANMIKAVDLVEKEAFIEPENEPESMLSISKEKTNSDQADDTFDSDNDR